MHLLLLRKDCHLSDNHLNHLVETATMLLFQLGLLAMEGLVVEVRLPKIKIILTFKLPNTFTNVQINRYLGLVSKLKHQGKASTMLTLDLNSMGHLSIGTLAHLVIFKWGTQPYKLMRTIRTKMHIEARIYS